jgi:hypothetical protein
MVGRRLLSGKEHEIRFKVCISLCNNIVPETDKLKRRAYFRAGIVQLGGITKVCC